MITTTTIYVGDIKMGIRVTTSVFFLLTQYKVSSAQHDCPPVDGDCPGRVRKSGCCFVCEPTSAAMSEGVSHTCFTLLVLF